jgi:L-2-hydroxycarboxylate dehydrogenase (NAD+)
MSLYLTEYVSNTHERHWMIRIPSELLREFALRCLISAGASDADARIVADTLIVTDLRGIDSHGVARLKRYVEGLKSGKINARAQIRMVYEKHGTAVLDAGNGLGQPAAVYAMDLAIAKAKSVGIGAVAVQHTNHFGIAGYYALQAVAQNMIGIATSNASPQVTPTHGAEPMYGTNPIAVAIPTGEARPFVLDMATSTVPRGKLQRMRRENRPIPRGWAIDPAGDDITDLDELIDGLKNRRGHALLPLGGRGEVYGGHKGFGLGLLVDLLCGPLAGAAWGRHVYGAQGANLGQCFVAVDISAFRPLDEFERDSGQAINEMLAAKKAEGAERIFIPGDKEHEEFQRRQRLGIPLRAAVYDDLKALAAECGTSLQVPAS